MTSTSDNSQRRVPWFWGGFFAVIGFGVVLALFAGIRAGLQWTQVEVENAMPPPVAALVKVTLAGGEALYVDPASVDSIRAQTREWLATRSTDTTAPLHDIIDRETAAMLVAAEAQIPTFADWYFSLAGEYARLLHAATDDLPRFMAGQLESLVFEPAGTLAAIEGLGPALDARFEEDMRAFALDLRNAIARLVREAGVETDGITVEVESEWALGDQLAGQLAPWTSLDSGDMVRQGAAVSAGAGLSAAAAKKIGALSVAKASAKIVTSEATGLLAATASKLGVKALAGAGGGAASGAALCAGSVVGAPLAPGCALVGGLITGVATWVLVDKAILEAEELARRDEFEAELRQALTNWREELRAELVAHYDTAVDSAMDALSDAIDHQLKPATGADGSAFIPARDAAGGHAEP